MRDLKEKHNNFWQRNNNDPYGYLNKPNLIVYIVLGFIVWLFINQVHFLINVHSLLQDFNLIADGEPIDQFK